MKQVISSVSVLRQLTLKAAIIISCDVSQASLGCVLLKKRRPVAFGTNALITAEDADQDRVTYNEN